MSQSSTTGTIADAFSDGSVKSYVECEFNELLHDVEVVLQVAVSESGEMSKADATALLMSIKAARAVVNECLASITWGQ